MKDLFHKPVKITTKEDNVFFWSDMLIRNPCEIAEGKSVSVTYISLSPTNWQ